MAKVVRGFPAWAERFLRRQGYRQDASMEQHVRAWWQWYSASQDLYRRGTDPAMPCEHLTLHPARMVAEEMASLVADGETVLSSPDDELNGWMAERLPDFVWRSASDIAIAFALGTGCWAVNLSGVLDAPLSPQAVATVDFYPADQIRPLDSDAGEAVSVALLSRAMVGGSPYDRLQVHEPDGRSGEYLIRTWLFDTRRHGAPVGSELVAPVVRTGSARPTFALVRPAVANFAQDHSPMGVSVFADGTDACLLVDEVFDAMYWRQRLCQPRLLVDEQGLARDPASGAIDLTTTTDQRLFKTIRGPVGGATPLTVYNPETRADESEQALNAALSMLSAKCGFGPGYFSWARQGGLRTAREVVADNSQLFRNVKRHEASVGEAVARAVAGAWSAEVALRTGRAPEEAQVDVQWDDSVVEDTEAERATMKDDIARGLCPAWLYPMRFYGMSEGEARALVAQAQAPAFPEEL